MQTTLGKMTEGDSGSVLRFARGERAYKQKLLSMGLTPGVEFTVLRVAPLGDPIEIKVRGSNLSLRKAEADIISVKMKDSE